MTSKQRDIARKQFKADTRSLAELAASATTTHAATGAKSSACPRLDLIPRRSLERLAARFEKGLERYGKDNWRKGATDKDYVCERLAHAIVHCYRLIDKLEGRLPDDGDDDASAIMWAGAFACEATEPREGAKGAA